MTTKLTIEDFEYKGGNAYYLLSDGKVIELTSNEIKMGPGCWSRALDLVSTKIGQKLTHQDISTKEVGPNTMRLCVEDTRDICPQCRNFSKATYEYGLRSTCEDC